MLLLRGVHHFSVTVSFSPFSRVLVPAMCKSPARDRKSATSINRDTTRRGILTLVPPTVFKELQVSVSVVEELDVVIGRRVGVLLFLLVPRDNSKVSVARSQDIYTCINAGREQHLNTADFMFLQWKEKLPRYFLLVYICQQ